MSEAAIATRGLTKDHGNGRGVFDLDLEVRTGEVFGFLGPNGAGKTTAIRTLMGSIRPTRGSATIFGLDSQRDAVAVKRRVGFLPGELPQFGSLRGDEVVAYLGALRGGVDAARVTALARRLEIDLGQRYREYSRGNKQKLGLIIAMMHRPSLLVLDEPTGGFDPLKQQTFYALVQEAQSEGATVFLSSHVLSEVEHVCDRVAIIRSGRVVKVGDLGSLQELRRYRVEVEFSGSMPSKDVLQACAGVVAVEIEGSRVRCGVSGSFDALLALLGKYAVVSMTSGQPTLEELFLGYYGNEAGNGEQQSVTPAAVSAAAR